MKRLIPFLLLFLALLYAGPHPHCLCSQETALRAVGKEHDCCKAEGTVSRPCPAAVAAAAIGRAQSCCGMVSESIPATVSVIDRVGYFERMALAVGFFGGGRLLPGSLFAIQQLQANRAPPYILGLGSHKTYLFKSTLLI